jgi:hypothetical protein
VSGPGAVKALLALVEGDVTAIYDQYDMLDEKRAAVARPKPDTGGARCRK